MPLSEHEQRILEQLERDLLSQDPKLATALKSKPGHSAAKIMVAAIGVLVGLLLLIVGVAQSWLWLGVIGFLLMFGAVTYAFAFPTRSLGSANSSARRHPSSGRKNSSRPNNDSFMQRLEDRWDKRSRGE